MYAITHNCKSYGPDGIITDIQNTPLDPDKAVDYNKQLEAKELEWLQQHPDKVTLYVKHPDTNDPMYPDRRYKVTTWLGTVVCEHAFVGPRRHIGFGYNTYRRAMTATIYGVLYHGWYFASSGCYCRLKKAKVQP